MLKRKNDSTHLLMTLPMEGETEKICGGQRLSLNIEKA